MQADRPRMAERFSLVQTLKGGHKKAREKGQATLVPLKKL